jgi:hypothetical protein
MRNQFFYKIKHDIGTAEAPEEKVITASLNVDMVIRSVELPSGELMIILNDFHQEMITLPDTVNIKTNKIIHGKKEMAVVQSEITLSEEDKVRFYQQTNIEI